MKYITTGHHVFNSSGSDIECFCCWWSNSIQRFKRFYPIILSKIYYIPYNLFGLLNKDDVSIWSIQTLFRSIQTSTIVHLKPRPINLSQSFYHWIFFCTDSVAEVGRLSANAKKSLQLFRWARICKFATKTFFAHITKIATSATLCTETIDGLIR